MVGENSEHGLAPGTGRETRPEDPITPCPEHWIQFRVIHDTTEAPIAGVILGITFPDQRFETHQTDGEGMIEFRPADPGTYGITSHSLEPTGDDELDYKSRMTMVHTVLDFVSMTASGAAADDATDEAAADDTAGRDQTDDGGGAVPADAPPASSSDGGEPFDAEPEEEQDADEVLRDISTTDADPMDMLIHEAEDVHPERLIAEVEEHHVETRETLLSLARQAGIPSFEPNPAQRQSGMISWEPWQRFAWFNWGVRDASGINRHLIEDVGCTHRAGDSYRFDSDDDPGIVYLPGTFEETGLEIDQTHTVRVLPIVRPARLLLQTVDENGYRVPSVALILRTEAGEEIAQIETDEHGRWSQTLELSEPAHVFREIDGETQPVNFYNYTASADHLDGSEAAIIDPGVARRTITSILIRRLEGERARELVRIRRRFSRAPEDRAVARERAAEVILEEPQIELAEEEGGEIPERQQGFFARASRHTRISTDNVFLAGGLERQGGRYTHHSFQGFNTAMRAWLEDRFPQIAYGENSYYVILDWGERLALLDPGRQGLITRARARLEPNTRIVGPFGAYSTFEHNVAGRIALRDMAGGRRAELNLALVEASPEGERVSERLGGDEETGYDIPLQDYVTGDNAWEFINAIDERMSRVPIYYHLPATVGQWLRAAFEAGTGLLEDYTGASDLNDRIHRRNVAVCQWTSLGYRGMISRYIERVNSDAVRTMDELLALGEPPDPYIFPLPGGLTYQDGRVTDPKWDELFEILNAPHSAEAWQAISSKVARIAGSVPEGAIFLRAQFQFSQRTSFPSLVGYENFQLSHNIDVGQDPGDPHVRISRRTQQVTQEHVAMGTHMPLPRGDVPNIGFGAARETDERGRQKTTVRGNFGPLTLEQSDDGGAKLAFSALPIQSESQMNYWTGEMSMGMSVSLHSCLGELIPAEHRAVWFDYIPNLQLSLAIHFQGIQRGSLIAFFTRAPGLWQRLSPEQLWRLDWSSLTSTERGCLSAMGWNNIRWRARLRYPGSFPTGPRGILDDRAQVRTFGAMHFQLQNAAVRLGLQEHNWQSFWEARLRETRARSRFEEEEGFGDSVDAWREEQAREQEADAVAREYEVEEDLTGAE